MLIEISSNLNIGLVIVAVMATQLTQTMGLQENTPETTTGNITEPIAPG
jgi:hypothetical protein